MSDLDSFDPRIGDVERRLKALSPRDARLNVAETLFRAGQESAKRHQTRWRIAWPLVTAACVLISVVTTATVVRRAEPRIAEVDRSIVVPEENVDDTSAERVVPDYRASISSDRDWVAEEKPERRSNLGYLSIRWLALEFGVDSLPTAGAVASNGNPPPLRYGDWRSGIVDGDLPFAESRRGGVEQSVEPLPGFNGGSS